MFKKKIKFFFLNSKNKLCTYYWSHTWNKQYGDLLSIYLICIFKKRIQLISYNNNT